MGDPDRDDPGLPQPLTAALLTRMPVFPLPGLVLLPGGLLPLHFFEPRYRELAADCVASEDRCLVIANIAAADAAGGASPPLLPRACVGRIVRHHENPDGTHDVLLEGLLRVQIEDVPSERAYRRVRARPVRDRLPPGGLPAGDHEIARALVASIARLAGRRHSGFEVLASDDDAPARWVDRVASQFVGDPDARQDLLETVDVARRLEGLIGHLVRVETELRVVVDGDAGPN